MVFRHVVMFGATLVACTSHPPGAPAHPSPRSADDAAAATRSLADRAAALAYEESPELVTYLGIAGQKHDRLADHSPATLRRFEAREDQLLREARAIDPAVLDGRAEQTLYAVLREHLEDIVATRVCHDELWPVNQFQGWQVLDAVVANAQPMGTDELRAQAITRWRSLPQYIDQEIANAREGLTKGYSTPKKNVSAVIAQLDALGAADPRKTPFFAPAQRDGSPDVQATFEKTIRDEIQPAIRRYRAFLADEYLPKARDTIGVSALPRGRECFRALLRRYSTRDVTPSEVHALGLAQVASLRKEGTAIAQRLFGSSNLDDAFAKLGAPPYTFKSRAEVEDVSRAAVARARAAVPRFFGMVPKADVVVKPAEEYRERNMVAMYVPAADDGSRPGTFVIVTYDPEKRSRAGVEATAFHETIPGHHLQLALEAESPHTPHPLTRITFNPGFREGWALYSERLADEMGVYTSDVDRLGMISEQLVRAARLVVDTGIHDLGWTRDQCVKYLHDNTVMPPGEIESEVDRYVIWPGQASSYMLGMLEFRAIREEAQKALGSRFDIRAFHDRVLEDGTMPFAALRAKIRKWTTGSRPG